MALRRAPRSACEPHANASTELRTSTQALRARRMRDRVKALVITWITVDDGRDGTKFSRRAAQPMRSDSYAFSSGTAWPVGPALVRLPAWEVHGARAVRVAPGMKIWPAGRTPSRGYEQEHAAREVVSDGRDGINISHRDTEAQRRIHLRASVSLYETLTKLFSLICYSP
jgi:hypothetical protein